jgi:SAM-dependent methyltransferase
LLADSETTREAQMATKARRDHEKLEAFVERIGDGAALPEGRFDLITTFDVIHDSVDPIGLLSAIRGALRENGTFLMLEMNASSDVEANHNPLGGLLHRADKLCRMTTSLAGASPSAGACIGEERARELAYAAGFRHFRKLPIENPCSVLYELKG